MMNDCFTKNVLLIKSKMTKNSKYVKQQSNKQNTIGLLRTSMGKPTNNVQEMSDIIIIINQFEKTFKPRIKYDNNG